MQVGVIVPCRAPAPYLDEALRSILGQEPAPAAVVVVDDGSHAPLGPLPAGVVFLRLEQSAGPAGARQAGLDALAPEVALVALCDADDAWEPGRLAAQLGALEKDGDVVACFADPLVVDAGGTATGETWDAPPAGVLGDPPALARLLYEHNPFCTSSALLRRGAVVAAGGFAAAPALRAEDWDLWLRLAAAGGRFAHVATPLVRYRRNPAGLTADVAALARDQLVLHERHAGLVGSETSRRVRAADLRALARGLARERRWPEARAALVAAAALAPPTAGDRALALALALPGLRRLLGRRAPYRGATSACPIRILLDTTYERHGPSGTGIYIARITEALRELGIDVVEAANEARRAPGGGGVRSVVNAAVDTWWVDVELPRRARAARAALIHHPLPAHTPLAGVPQVVTVHDLAFERLPECFDARYRAWARRVHRGAARRADAVVCVSETTARDVRALWGVPEERLVVARHGPGQELEPHRRLPKPRHFLYVGDDEPRKNLATLLAAHARYREAALAAGADPLPLVLAGSATANGDGVEIVARPDAERLAQLHAAAAALVHPALHEGFGLTLLEALGQGTPVIAARAPGVVEICADAAVMIDPRDPDAVADALTQLAQDGELRRDLAERGRRRAAAFSWRRAAQAHLTAYEAAVRGPAAA